ncbi:hypothetical protein [Flexilinea flocculi]|jgi:hypothetical protein|uniref:Uncharacterized protein n=1 Tax=Flexilinea flocculi TaxID=1678840 RepID=A0A0S7BN14_9CHLR|nr:hypothetical protein [Flexilinea flocculi]NMB94867.1 hypothetical protein [Flexilinea flocculi]GAP41818.1 hypothetical protein ATC1_131814 [Flexilinea flocculi]
MSKEKFKKQQNKRIYWIPFFILITIVIFALILADPFRIITLDSKDGGLLKSAKMDESAIILPTLTPLPENYPKLPREFFENENQTNGIILGGTILVLIIVIGTLISIKNEHRKT